MEGEVTFGSWLKNCRKALDLTQDELAWRVGCSPELIQKIEANGRRPSRQIAELLALHLDIPLDERPDFVRFARSKNSGANAKEKFPWRAMRIRQTNLPIPPAPIFGRQQDIDAILRRITHEQIRLLTLVGPPGVGKTRLALACAEQLLDHFDDGLYFVNLAQVSEAEHVAQAIARTLKVAEIAGCPILDTVKETLATRRMLLLLDNFEQVVSAAPLVAELLEACPWLYVLVTSRVSLHIRAERQFPVSSLALPVVERAQECLLSPAVQFLIDRVRAQEPGFAPAPEEAIAIGQICAHLEGLPLAIEIVATQASMFSPQELLAQLERGSGLSSQGPRDLPARHQSLRQTLDWSYALLEAREQALFASLGVFVAGFTREAAEQVCGQTGSLARLVDHSLLRYEDQRYGMLATIHEYALERLEKSEAASEIHAWHLNYFLHLAEAAESELSGGGQIAWLDRLEREHHNLRAALRWALDTGDAEKALRLSGALWRFWQTRGYLSEGLEWLQTALNLEPVQEDVSYIAGRVKALIGMGWLWRDFGDFSRMKDCFEESLAFCEKIEDKSILAYAMYCNGYADFLTDNLESGVRMIERSVALHRTLPQKNAVAQPLFMLGRIAIAQGNFRFAQECLEESLEIEERRGARFGVARTLGSLGELAIYRNEHTRAREYLEQSYSILDELGERQLSAWVLTKRGELAWRQGEFHQAHVFLETSLKFSQEIGYRWNTAYTLTYLGLVALSEGNVNGALTFCQESITHFKALESAQDVAQSQKDLARVLTARGDYPRAQALYRECMEVLMKRGFLPDEAECLEGLATIFDVHGSPATAIRLFAAAYALRQRIGAPMPPILQPAYQTALERLLSQAGEREFAEGWAEGLALTPEQALKRAVEDHMAQSSP